MKKLFVMVMCVALSAAAQFKQKPAEEPRVSDSFIQPQSSSDWFSFFNPNNFQMHHSYSASYSSFGGHGVALQQYTNTMLYQFAPNLDARVDISLQNSPYSTFSSKLQNSFNSVYLNRAEISYRPWENTQIRLSYRQFPGNYLGYYSPYGSLYSGVNFFESE